LGSHLAQTGQCRVCQRSIRLSTSTGKIMMHGWKRAERVGCEGSNQAPLSRRELRELAEQESAQQAGGATMEVPPPPP